MKLKDYANFKINAAAVQNAIKKTTIKTNGTNKVGSSPKVNTTGTIKNIRVGGHS